MRQSINVNPGLKEFEAYMDFSGGLNTETSNERLTENEFVQMQNVNLNTRGSVKKRTGRIDITPTNMPLMGNPQGLFFFYRKSEPKPDVIFAFNGFLYAKKHDSNSVSPLLISGLKNMAGNPVSQFQTTSDIEAVQYYDQLYVATGFGLAKVTYNVSTSLFEAAIVTPYEPNSNELRFIGSNALLGYGMQNTTDVNLTNISQFTVKGITFAQNGGYFLLAGEVKVPIVISGFVKENPAIIPSGSVYNKSFELYYKKSDSVSTETITYTSTTGQSVYQIPANSSYNPNTNSIQVYVDGVEHFTGVDFTETNSNTITFLTSHAQGKKVTLKWIPYWRRGTTSIGVSSLTTANIFSFVPLEIGLYDFKIEVLFTQTTGGALTATSLKEYVFERFQVKAMQEDGDVLTQQISGLKFCTRIRLHWDRLVLFGDPYESSQLYFSDLNNPAYFPQTNTIRFESGKQEPITTIVRLNDYLVVFSKTVVYTLTGKAPSQFAVSMINDKIGCTAPKSAVVTGNVITFLSQEGIYMLKPASFRLDQLNVQRVDTKIKDEIPHDTNATALSHDSQYWICYPTQKLLYRYYYEQGVWVKDVSDKLNITHFVQNGEDVFNFTTNLKLYQHDTSVYTDAGLVYDMIVESKYFDLSKSFNFKKLRRLYVLGKCYDLYDVNFYTSVYADNTIVLDPETGSATVTPAGVATWVTTLTPNVTFEHGTTFGLPPYTPATTWQLGFDELGHKYLSVQKTRIRGKCRRVKVMFVNSQDKEVEIFGFGLEFKLKKP